MHADNCISGAGSPPAGPYPTGLNALVFWGVRGFRLTRGAKSLFLPLCSSHGIKHPHSISSTSIVNDFFIVMNIAWMTILHHLASCSSGRLTSKAASLYLEMSKKKESKNISFDIQYLTNSDVQPLPCRATCTCTSSDWTYRLKVDNKVLRFRTSKCCAMLSRHAWFLLRFFMQNWFICQNSL